MREIGLVIKPVGGEPFSLYGDVSRKELPDDGPIYYCRGESWPVAIVEKVLYDEEPSSNEGAMNRQQWLKERLNGIGASDAAAIAGLSPYMTNTELWEIKTRRKPQEDISEKPYVKYGTEAEAHLRALFALDFPQYHVDYREFKMIRNPDYPFIFATLDGELTEIENGRQGILEIKTTEIMRSNQWDEWNDRIPEGYYCQILHQLLATGYDFAILKAQIKWRKGDDINLTTRHYHIERKFVLDDIEHLLKEEIKFWELVKENRRPNTILPQI